MVGRWVFCLALSILYQASTAPGGLSPLPELALQYADFAVWQRHWLQGDTLTRHLTTYWRKQLADLPARLAFHRHPRCDLTETNHGPRRTDRSRSGRTHAGDPNGRCGSRAHPADGADGGVESFKPAVWRYSLYDALGSL